MPDKLQEPTADGADPDWFRQPTPREHRIAGWLFTGFGVFFVLLFLVERSFSFRWVILALGIISILRGFYHWLRAARHKNEPKA